MSNTGRARRKWTPDEDALLRDAVQCALDQSRPLLWRELAKSVPGRSNKDCRRRWWNSLAEGTAKGLWSEDEDDLLMKAVQKYGTNWRTVAQDVGTRTPDQCSSHWTQVLDPAINHCDWTSKEDDDLLHEVLTYATNWKTISTIHTPGRTTLSLKNRYSTLRLKFQKKANLEKSPSKRAASTSSSTSSPASSKRSASPEYIPSHRSSSQQSHNHRSSILEPAYAKLPISGCDVISSSRPMSPISQFLVVGGGSRASTSYCSTPTYGCSTPTYSNASLPGFSGYRNNSSGSSSDSSEAMTPMSMHGSPLLSSNPNVFLPKSDITSAFGMPSKTQHRLGAPLFGADYGMSSLFEQEDIPGGNELDFLSSFNTQVFTGMDTAWN